MAAMRSMSLDLIVISTGSDVLLSPASHKSKELFNGVMHLLTYGAKIESKNRDVRT
jgi:hypothetical protein